MWKVIATQFPFRIYFIASALKQFTPYNEKTKTKEDYNIHATDGFLLSGHYFFILWMLLFKHFSSKMSEVALACISLQRVKAREKNVYNWGKNKRRKGIKETEDGDWH